MTFINEAAREFSTNPSKEEREIIIAWLENQCANLVKPMADHVMAGRSIDDPIYRLQLGQHQAFMRARSFMSGHCKAMNANPMKSRNEHHKGSGG